MTKLDEITIEHACARLIHRFALLNDAHEWPALAELFAEEGRFARPADPTNVIVGKAAILAFFQGRPARFSRHLVSNVIVTADSSDSAHGQSTIILYTASQTPDAGGLPVADASQFIGAYHDRFSLTKDGWRFAERQGSLAMKTSP